MEHSSDSMGQSISEQEKRQVLIEVLKELCYGGFIMAYFDNAATTYPKPKSI